MGVFLQKGVAVFCVQNWIICLIISVLCYYVLENEVKKLITAGFLRVQIYFIRA